MNPRMKTTKAMPINKKWNRGKAVVHLFPVPALVIYLVFVIYPIVSAFFYSLYDWDGMTRGAYIGIKNFIHLFTLEPFNDMFWRAFKHNVIYFTVEMAIQNGVAFTMAYIVYMKIRGSGFFKAAFFMPRLLSVIVVGFLWKLLLNPNSGAVNFLLESIGLGAWARPWLGDPDTALIAVILVNSWFGMGFAMLIFLAGLQAIPREVIESARLEGARRLKLLTSVVFPMMIPSITVVTVFTFIQSFEAFELVYAMQGSTGEPYYSTDLLAVYFYRLAFGGANETQVGLGSALAVVLFGIIASITALFLTVIRRREVEL